jgi:ubiquinone/menaquinone biosynthesis C-methylase UbiE
MEKFWSRSDEFKNVLEVSAGAGCHRQFVKHKYSAYHETDIRLHDSTLDSRYYHEEKEHQFQVIRGLADVNQLPYEDESFDRVIATCLLLHLEKPEKALYELNRVTNKHFGVISILVPCEPGILLRASRRLLTTPKAKRLGFSGYELFNARDHRNHISGVDKMIRHVFQKDRIRVSRHPFLLASWNLNLYFVYTIYREFSD